MIKNIFAAVLFLLVLGLYACHNNYAAGDNTSSRCSNVDSITDVCNIFDSIKTFQSTLYFRSAVLGLDSPASKACNPGNWDTTKVRHFALALAHNLKKPFNYVSWFPTDKVDNLKFFKVEIVPSTKADFVNVTLSRTNVPILKRDTNVEVRINIVGVHLNDITQYPYCLPQPTNPPPDSH